MRFLNRQSFSLKINNGLMIIEFFQNPLAILNSTQFMALTPNQK